LQVFTVLVAFDDYRGEAASRRDMMRFDRVALDVREINACERLFA
jgi:hypothetical protein